MVDEKRKTIKISLNKKQSKQVLWALILMIALLLIVLGTPYVIKNYFNKFVYLKLDFEKTQLGTIKFYSTKIPVTNVGWEIIGVYSMNFRNDPRKLEYIGHNIDDNKIEFKRENATYISFNPDMKACDNTTIALMNLAGFLKGFGNLNISSAVTYYDYARENNLSYVTCDNSPDNTVIIIDEGEKTEINKISDRCYLITYNNCEIMQVTEKFMLIIIEGYMSYFDRD